MWSDRMLSFASPEYLVLNKLILVFTDNGFIVVVFIAIKMLQDSSFLKISRRFDQFAGKCKKK